MKAEYSFHHIGILTPSIKEAIRLYVATFHYAETSTVIAIPTPGILVSSLEREGSPRIELIEPTDKESPLGKRALSGTGGYHLGWSVPDLKSAQVDLEENGFHGMAPFTSSLWENSRCLFMVGPNQELIEFIENPAESSINQTS